MILPEHFKLVNGDILKSDAFVVVNPVNCKGAMGKGLALQFKKKYPSMYRQYNKYCESGLLKPGDVFQYLIEDITSRVRYISCIATKDDWRNDSKLAWIEEGCANLSIKLDQAYIVYKYNRFYGAPYDDIKSNVPMEVAIPALGCGEGHMTFDEVLPIMVKNLYNSTRYNINVYLPH